MIFIIYLLHARIDHNKIFMHVCTTHVHTFLTRCTVRVLEVFYPLMFKTQAFDHQRATVSYF